MSGTALEDLLYRIRDGVAGEAELERARELLRDDARFPADLRVALDDEPEISAGALLACLGVDDGLGDSLFGAIAAEAHGDVAHQVIGKLFPGDWELPVAAAVASEAGDIEVTAAVLQALELEMAAVPIAEAVEASAGRVEIVEQVLHALDLSDAALPIADAVRDQAGRVDVAPAVMTSIDGSWVSALLDHELDADAHRLAAARLREDREAARQMTHFAALGRQVREAVSVEAGEVSGVWADIASRIGIEDSEAVPGWDGALFAEAVRAESGEIDVTHAVMSRVMSGRITAGPEIPEPANRPWRWPTLALAAAALLAVVVGVPSLQTPSGVEGTSDLGEMQFAQADEITVNDLSYAENAMVQVFQAEGDEGPLIIWVDEEASL